VSRSWATAAALTPRFGRVRPAAAGRDPRLAAVPLPGIGSPIGGLVFFLEEEWAFDERQRGLLEATARRVADAVRRIRVGSHALHEEPLPDGDA
jgi:hypothetical protein